MKIIGQENIAAAFGVAPKTIVEWQASGFPVAKFGGPGVPSEYELAACIRWLIAREVAKVAGPESPRDRLYRIQGDKASLELAEIRGQMIRAALIEPRIKGAVIAAREFLMSQPPRLAALLEGKTKAQRELLLRQTFGEFLTRLSDWRRGGLIDEDEDVASTTPPTTEGESA